jgi:hypothetical protein
MSQLFVKKMIRIRANAPVFLFLATFLVNQERIIKKTIHKSGFRSSPTILEKMNMLLWV